MWKSNLTFSHISRAMELEFWALSIRRPKNTHPASEPAQKPMVANLGGQLVVPRLVDGDSCDSAILTR